MLKFITLIIFLGLSLFASGGGTGETDIVHRTINFLIFAAIVYYLLANKIKEFFASRSNLIASELERAQNKLKESRRVKDEALSKLETSKKIAADILESSKGEMSMILQKMDESLKIELEYLQKHYEDMKNLEIRKAKMSVVEEVLEKTTKSESLLNKEYSSIIIKKVA